MSIPLALAFAIVASFALLSHASNDAPPSLALGMTLEQAQAVVPSMEELFDDRNISINTVKVVPLAHARRCPVDTSQSI